MPIREIIHFLKEDVWKISLKDLSARKSVLIKNLRIVLLAFKGFYEDKCILRAQALTFYSLLSLVPLVAFLFGIAKGFGMQKVLEEQLEKSLQGQEQVVAFIIDAADKQLLEAKGGLIAGIGIVVLLYTVFNLMQSIEKSFNEIWGEPHSRSFGRKFSDYLTFLFIAPILFILSSGITVFVKTAITPIMSKIMLLGPILSKIIFFSLKISPFFVFWVLLLFMYIFMPNTRVRFRSGFMGGVVAGTIYVVWQILYITLQIGFSKAGTIYGSLAALPLFMIWLQVSWLIILFGAEIAFAHQNVDTYEMEPMSETVSVSLKKILSLRVANICIKNFVKGENPWSAQKIAEFLELPVRLTNKLLDDLVKCHILSETEGDDEKICYYQPARDVNALTIHYVTSSLEKLGNDDIKFAESDEIEKIKKCYEKLDAMYNGSDANILLKDV
ncbi:MAG: YihY/virulence factor BrkB family protein [Desulfobacteraceae bacterium]